MQKKQSKLFKKLSDKNKGEKPFLINVGFLRDARQKVLNSFKSNIFPQTHFTPESTLVPSSNQTVKSKAQITTIQQKTN